MEDLEALTNLSANELWVTHLFYKEEYAKVFKEKNVATLFMYRDPRDQVVSFAFYMLEHKEAWPQASMMSFDNLLLDIINNGTVFNDYPPVKGVRELYESYLPWLDDPNVLSIRFEDLVGPKGRKDPQEDQLQVIKRIIQYLGLSIPESTIYNIAQSLFGDIEGTFREGKIGSWKKYFKQHHIDAFKAAAGDLLIKLGYEQDMNWGTCDENVPAGKNTFCTRDECETFRQAQDDREKLPA